MNFCPETDKLFNVLNEHKVAENSRTCNTFFQSCYARASIQRSIIDNVSKHFMYNFCVSFSINICLLLSTFKCSHTWAEAADFIPLLPRSSPTLADIQIKICNTFNIDKYKILKFCKPERDSRF